MRGAVLLLLGSSSAFCPGDTAALDIEEARMGQSVSPEHSAAQWPLLDHHTIETGRFETGDIMGRIIEGEEFGRHWCLKAALSNAVPQVSHAEVDI